MRSSSARGRWLPGLALLGSLGMAACAPDLLDSSPPSAQNAVSTTLHGIVLEGFSPRGRDFEVRAKEARVDITAENAVLSGVVIHVLDERRGAVNVRADTAEVGLRTEDFVLRGNVSGETGAGEQFETDQVVYDNEAGELTTDRPVRLVRPNLVFSGRGMTFDLETRRLTFRGGVEAEVDPR